MAKSKSKIPVKRYPSDDLILALDGEEYAIHKGEWVEMRRGVSWAFVRDATELARLSQLDDEQLTPADMESISRSYSSIAEYLASRIVAWSWTDLDGRPLPKPSKAVIEQLSDDEVYWLVTVLRRGAPPAQAEVEEKNS